MVQGSRSITFHSTAALSKPLNTVRTLLTVFGAFAFRAVFRRCTSSLVIASSRLDPSSRVQVDA